MARLRIAVIGAGLIGRTHIAALRSGHAAFELAGVADPSPEAAKEAREKGYEHFLSYEDLLDHARPDGAIVAVPNQLHRPVALACIARGIPIIVEKPLADNMANALSIVEAAEKSGVPVLTGHHRRHNPIMRRAREIVAEGGLGRVVAATAHYLSHKPKPYYDVAWRREPGGGPLLINAIHDIDCLRMLLGDVESVQAISSNAVRGFPVEDTAAAILRFRHGALGTLIVSDTASTPWSWEWGARDNPAFPYDSENCFFLAGTLGSLALPSLVHRWHEPGKESWHVPLTMKRNYVAPVDVYVAQIENFVGVIRGIEEPACSGWEGAKTLATTLAISQSAKSGAAVRVADLMRLGA